MAEWFTVGVGVGVYALVERAVAAYSRLGRLVQVWVSRAADVGVLGFRLVPENPVFVVWGPAGRERDG